MKARLPAGARIERLVFPCFLVGLSLLFLAYREPLLELSRSPAAARAWIDRSGVAAPLAFMALQAFQVLVFAIPGEVVQFAGGFLFGIWEGALLSTLGILAGSAANFWIGRRFGRPFIEWLLGAERFGRLEHATASGKAAAGFFFLYVIPGFPKDGLTYFAGASALSFPLFVATSTLGRLPGILGSSYMGSATFEREFAAAIVVLVLASALFLVGLVFRDRVTAILGELLRRFSRRV